MIKLDLLIVGAGGNGQSYFMNFLKKNKIKINSINDKDGLKHKSCPSKIPKKYIIKKCIFLFNEPLSSIKSHYRREWPFIQMKKLENPYNLKKKDIKPISKLFKLTEEKNTDIYGIKYQFDNWYNADLEYPILFLNFNDVINEKDRLNKFLGKELNYSLFNIKERRQYNEENKNIEDIYDNLYKYIINKTNELK